MGKRPREIDRNSGSGPEGQDRTNWSLDKYRKDEGLPKKPEEGKMPETPHTQKTDWAVDQARLYLNNLDQQATSANRLLHQLEEYNHARNTEDYKSIWEEMRKKRESNEYIKRIMDTIDKGFSQNTFESERPLDYTKQVLPSVRTQFDAFLAKQSDAFIEAKNLFDNLSKAIKARNKTDFEIIDEEIYQRHFSNMYIRKGRHHYRGALFRANLGEIPIEKEDLPNAAKSVKNDQGEQAGSDPMEE